MWLKISGNWSPKGTLLRPPLIRDIFDVKKEAKSEASCAFDTEGAITASDWPNQPFITTCNFHWLLPHETFISVIFNFASLEWTTVLCAAMYSNWAVCSQPVPLSLGSSMLHTKTAYRWIIPRSHLFQYDCDIHIRSLLSWYHKESLEEMTYHPYQITIILISHCTPLQFPQRRGWLS